MSENERKNFSKVMEERIKKNESFKVAHDELTKKIEELKAQGYTRKEIAVKCGLNESTIRAWLK